MNLIPDDTIRLFINVNKGVVRHIRNNVFIFVNEVFIGTVKNNSIEDVFKSIYNTEGIFIKKVHIQEFDKFNDDATLIIKLK